MRVHIGPYPDYGEGERQIETEFHKYDTWNLNHTLALIIAPLLRQFKETKYGYPSQFSDNKYGGTGEGPEKWDEILDKMIWTFEWYAREDKYLGIDKATLERRDEGLRLFAQYYPDLWD